MLNCRIQVGRRNVGTDFVKQSQLQFKGGQYGRHPGTTRLGRI
jgi:hypothetical protein